MRTRAINKIRVLPIILALCFFAMPFGQHGIQRAEALTVSVISDTSATGIGNFIKNTLSEVSNAFIAGVQKSLALKEFTLDGIARNIAQTALNQMTADMVNWINGGMNGEPAFVTNLEEFLLGVADQAAGEFIYGPELDALCEPIQFQVKAALLTQYTEEGRGTYTPQCTLDSIAGVDVEAFMSGDFSQGGWGAYFELMVGSNNDPIKAYLDGSVEMYTRNLDSQLQQQEQLAWGDGFLSKQACEFIEDATGFSRQRCESVTPGALVRDALSYFVGELPAQRLLEIDEFNEIFTALGASLTNQAIQGTFGLLGLGGNDQYSDNRFGSGSQSYLDALRDEKLRTEQSVTQDVIDQAVEAEEEYAELQQQIVDEVDELEEQLAEWEEDYPSCDLELTEQLEEDRETALENIEISALVLAALIEIQTELAEAETSAEQEVVYQKYVALQTNDLIRTEYDNAKLRIEFIEVEFRNRVDEFKTEINQELQRCSGSGNQGP